MSFTYVWSLSLLVGMVAVDDPPGGPAASERRAGMAAVGVLEDAFADAIEKAEVSVVAIARTKSEDGETRAILGLAPPLKPNPEGMITERQLRDLNRPGVIMHRFELGDQDGGDNLEFDYGSGVVVGSEGQILTAYHVVKGAARLQVRATGRQEFDALIIAADPRCDLAVIVPNIPPGSDRPVLKPIALGDSTKLRKGSFLLALGNPYNAARDGNASAAWGILANVSRRIEAPRTGQTPQLSNYPMLLQLDAKLNLGMSGAAVVNLKGELVGLTTSAGDPEGFDPRAGYAIPLDRLGRRAVESLIDGREVEYGFLGIRLPTIFREFGPVKTNLVNGVTPGTPADLGGLIQGDEIISVGDYLVWDSDTLIVAVGSYPVGSLVKVKVLRDGKVLEKTIPLSKFPTEGTIIATNRPKPWRGLRVDYTSTLARGTFGAEVFEAMARSPIAIIDVAPESSAAVAGLKRGQILLKVAGKPVRSPAEFAKLVGSLKGDVVLTTEMGNIVVHEELGPRRVNRPRAAAN